MRIFSGFFNPPEKPEPYTWAFLRDRCLQAIEGRGVPRKLLKPPLGELDCDRLEVSGEAPEEVVMEIWSVLNSAKNPELTATEAEEYLDQADDLLRSGVGPEEALSRLQEIEASVRKRS